MKEITRYNMRRESDGKLHPVEREGGYWMKSSEVIAAREEDRKMLESLSEHWKLEQAKAFDEGVSHAVRVLADWQKEHRVLFGEEVEKGR